MKYLATWSLYPGNLDTAVHRFLAGQGSPAKGVKLLGRWHNVDFSGGFTLYEAENSTAIYETAAVWADLMDLSIKPVVEDAEAGPVLTSVFKK